MIRTRVFLVLLIMAVAATAGAQRMRDPAGPEIEVYRSTVIRMAERNADTPIGEITVGEIQATMGRLSVLRQQANHVRKSAMASFAMPGAGHVMNKEVGKGILFATGDLLISAGTLVGSYFVLPESVRFGQLNYFTDTYGQIEQAWLDLSFMDVLPAVGIMTAGAVVDALYRGIAAKAAGRTAREKIRSGELTFEPRPTLMLGPGGMPMLGVHMRRRR